MDRVSKSAILLSESLEECHHVNCAIPNMDAILLSVHSQICIHINVWLAGNEKTSWVLTSRAQQGSLRGLTCILTAITGNVDPTCDFLSVFELIAWPAHYICNYCELSPHYAIYNMKD